MKSPRSARRLSASVFSFALGRPARRFKSRAAAAVGRRSAAVAAVEFLEDRALLSSVSLTDRPTYFTINGQTVAAHTDDQFVDPATIAAAGGTPSAAPPFPVSDTFKLHSLPGSNYTLYIDFDGAVTSGTFWNSSYNNNNPIVSVGYDADGSPTTYNLAEQELMQRVWKRVAEDFAPFNVDVTTEDPGVEALRKSGAGDTQWGVRAVVTADDSWLRDDGIISGGIAYLGSFSWGTDTPVWVFNGANSVGLFGEMVMADTVSHEVGHSLGLSHDGRTTPSEGYYGGHGSPTDPTSWAPIMGAFFADGSNNLLTQWSKGEYTNANNTEDDLAIITDPTKNGAGFGWSGLSYLADLEPDEDFTTPGTEATALTITAGQLGGQGLIERTGDVDAWYFDWAGGLFNIDINPAEDGPNLDIQADLLDSTGAAVASSNLPNEVTAVFTDVPLVAGRYYIRIKGSGKSANGTDQGYSNYGSLGAYTIGVVPGVTDDFYETNNTLQTAFDPLGNGGEWSNEFLSSINGQGKSRNDDYYLINVTADFSHLFAQLTFQASQADLNLYLYDLRGRLLGASEQSKSSFEQLDLVVPAAGKYVLLVRANGAARGATYDLFWDDEAVASPRVSVTVSSPAAVAEDSGQDIVFTFRRTDGGLGESLTAGFLVSGTARAGIDYTVTGGSIFGTAGQVTFAAGSATAEVRIRPRSDSTIELDETVALTVNQDGGFLGYQTGNPASAVGRILNDDPQNKLPVARDDASSTGEDGPLVVNVLSNDTDADGDPLSVLSVDTTGLLGTIQINGDGTLTYDPGAAFQNLNAGQTALESFTYVVTDGRGGTATATVRLTINGANDPTATADAARTNEYAAATGNVLTNDSDPDASPLSVTAVNGDAAKVGQTVTLASGAKLRVNTDGTYTYDPAGAFVRLRRGESATDSFNYTITSGTGGTATATVTITIDGGGGESDVIGFNDGVWKVGLSDASSFVSGNWASWAPNGWEDLLQGDFNGDGLTDVAGRMAGATAGLWYVGLSNGTSFQTGARPWAAWKNAGWHDVAVGDVDGDGKDDIFGRASDGSWFVARSTGAGFENVFFAKWNEAAQWRDVRVLDINGDGKSDLAGRASDGWYYATRYFVREGKNVAETFRYVNWGGDATRDVRVLDVNGDGKDDIAGRTADGKWFVTRLTSGGAAKALFASWTESLGWRDVRVGDFDGNGKDDIAGRTADGRWVVLRSNGTTGQNTPFGTWVEADGWRDVVVGDFDGDGLDDIAGRKNNGDWSVLASRLQGDVLTSVAKAFGNWDAAKNFRALAAAETGTPPIVPPGPSPLAQLAAGATAAFAPTTGRDKDPLATFWSKPDDKLEAGLLSLA